MDCLTLSDLSSLESAGSELWHRSLILLLLAHAAEILSSESGHIDIAAISLSIYHRGCLICVLAPFIP